MKTKEFISMFKGYNVPKELTSLFELQKSENVPSYYSNGLYLLEEESDILESFSTNEEFLQSFLPFAEANNSGSIYAFWIKDKSVKNLSECPIVVFGDEGGAYVVAANFNVLLQIAAYDVEAFVDAEEFFFSDKDILEEDGEFDATEFNKEYIVWLRNEAKLKPLLTIDGVDEVVAAAEDENGQDLADFLAKVL